MINFNNYEEYLIDYLHGELDETGIIEIEHFINEHPEIKVEYELLKQTIFAPETDVIFTDKKSLIKPITVPFYITFKKQLAAAAVVTGLALSGLYFLNPGEKKDLIEIHVKNETSNDQYIPSQTAPVHVPEEAAEIVKVNVPENQKSGRTKVNRQEMARVRKYTAPVKNQVAENIENLSLTKDEAPQLLQQHNTAENAEVLAIRENPVIETHENTLPTKNDASAATQSATAKSKLTLNKQKQPRLFKAIGQFVKLTRKVKDTRETIANSGLTVIVGNKKIINLN